MFPFRDLTLLDNFPLLGESVHEDSEVVVAAAPFEEDSSRLTLTHDTASFFVIRFPSVPTAVVSGLEFEDSVSDTHVLDRVDLKNRYMWKI